MAIAQSKVTSQGQISIPAEVRKQFGIVPGTTIEWIPEGDKLVVRKARKYTSEEIHRILFPNGPPKRVSLKRLKEAVGEGAVADYLKSIKK